MNTPNTTGAQALTPIQRDLLRNLGVAMASERSREKGDAWDQLAELFRDLSTCAPSPLLAAPGAAIAAREQEGDVPKAGSFLMQKIDAAADALSEVLAFQRLNDDRKTKVARALSGLRGLQSIATPSAASPEEAPATAAWAIPDECPHMIVFDDAEISPLAFTGSGARQAALKTFERKSVQWNAHLFVRIAHNSRDDRYPDATPPAAIPAAPGEVTLRCANAKRGSVPVVAWTERHTMAAIKATASFGSVKLTDEHGAYDIDRPTFKCDRLVEAIIAIRDAQWQASLLAKEAECEALTAIKQAISDYYYALDMRQHGGVAQDRAFSAICNALDMHWTSGAEKARRAAIDSARAAADQGGA